MKLITYGLLIASLAGIIWISGSLFFNTMYSREDDRLVFAEVGLLSTVVFVSALTTFGFMKMKD